MQSGILGGPSTFRVGGVQYIAFMTGKGGPFALAAGVAGGVTRKLPNIPRLVVLKIGGTVKLPAPPATKLAWNPRRSSARSNRSHRARRISGAIVWYATAIARSVTGFTPDLRVSGLLTNADAWKTVIIDGALKDRGMVSFARVLTPADAEAIRAYVIDRSTWTKANLPDVSAPVGR
jgi:quinohemoprotein ethanol dehydrogenase